MSALRKKSKKKLQTHLQINNNVTPKQNQLMSKTDINLLKIATSTPSSTSDEEISLSKQIPSKQQPENVETNMNNILKQCNDDSALVVFMKQMAIAMQEMSTQLKNLNGSVSAYQCENKKMQEQLCEIIDEFQKIQAENLNLKAQLDKVYQTEAKFMIAVHGVPNEADSMSIVKKLGDLLEIDVHENQIADIYRIHTKKKQPTSPIVVKFLTRAQRDLFVGHRKHRSIFTTDLTMGYEKKQVFVNEYLTKETINLLQNAKKLKKECNFEFIWTKNGIIYAKESKYDEPIIIKNESEIYKIIENFDVNTMSNNH
jgi:regulator of replication initiation timing